MSLEQSQINACRSWRSAGYSALAISTALQIAPGTVRKAVLPATKFGKTQLPATWSAALDYPFPKSYTPNLAGVYKKFLRRMAIHPPLELPALAQLLLPCTFPSWQLPEWVAHYNRLRGMRQKIGLIHLKVMRAWNSQQAQKPPPSSAPALGDRSSQSSP